MQMGVAACLPSNHEQRRANRSGVAMDGTETQNTRGHMADAGGSGRVDGSCVVGGRKFSWGGSRRVMQMSAALAVASSSASPRRPPDTC